MLSALVFAGVYGVGVLVSFLSGDLQRFLNEPRYLWPPISAGLSSFALGRLPRAIGDLWTKWAPWLANPDVELIAFQAAIPGLLTRGFWLIALLVLGLYGQYLFMEDPWAIGILRPDIYRFIYVIWAPTVAYFAGGAGAVAAFGLGAFAHHAAKVLDLKRGFILGRGKAALQPFNQVLWMLWGLTVLPILAFGLLNGLVNVTTGGGTLDQFVWAAVEAVLVVISIVVPQRQMNHLLEREKAEELRLLREELADASIVPGGASTQEAVQALVRHQHLLYQIEEAKAFVPTLVDTRFAVQIGISVTAIVAANVALRTVLARFLP
jgi:hypothetical protein